MGVWVFAVADVVALGLGTAVIIGSSRFFDVSWSYLGAVHVDIPVAIVSPLSKWA